MGKKLLEMSLEELWQLFPIYLTEHNDDWAGWYASEAEYLCEILPMQDVKRIDQPYWEYIS